MLQKYVVPHKRRPQIYRVDIARNGSIRVYALRTKTAEYLFLQKNVGKSPQRAADRCSRQRRPQRCANDSACSP